MTSENEDLASLREKIQESRERAGLSKRQLADRAGVHLTYIGKLESGQKKPSAEVLQRIAEALHLDANELLTLIGLQPSSTLPSPRMYFRRKFDMSEDEADVLARLVEHQLATKQRKETPPHEATHP